jgi:hypothetical protein
MYLGCLGCTISSLILSIIPLIISDLLFNPDIEKKTINFFFMSDYKKENWQAIWDGLFWRFIHSHRD